MGTWLGGWMDLRWWPFTRTGIPFVSFFCLGEDYRTEWHELGRERVEAPAPPQKRRGKKKTDLPPIPTILTLAKRRHRLIRTPRLRLIIRHLPLLALPALKTRADTPLRLRHLCILQILLLIHLILLLLLGGFQILMAHHDEPVRCDFAVEDAHAQRRVLLVLEVLEEGADFGFVGFLCFRAEGGVGGGFDGGGDGDNGAGGDGGGVREAVVEETDAAVARGLVGAVDGDAVFFVIALLGRYGWFRGFGRSRCWRGRFGCSAGRGGHLLGAIRQPVGHWCTGFGLGHLVPPLPHDFAGEPRDSAVRVRLEPIDCHADLCGP